VSSLDVDDLHVAYDATRAVDGLDLHVGSGEVVTLLGPSGCGKSTVLRAVAGLVTPDRGRVRIDGEDVTSTPPHQRAVGLMFQDYALFPHRDVAGNVAFGPRMQGLAGGDIDRKVDEALALVGLSGYGRRAVASLSGGEQQRVALARALAPSPRVLLLDEPLGSLDRALRERLTVELRDLFRAIGATTVTVTHDQAEAFTLADRVVVLRGGRVVQEGAPVDVWHRPADGFVARFLGFANVFDVDVRGGRVDGPLGAVPTDRADGPACLVVRPDGLRLRAGGAIQGVAGVAGFRNDRFVVPVDVGEATTVEVVARPDEVPAPGATVALDRVEGAVLVVDR